MLRTLWQHLRHRIACATCGEYVAADSLLGGDCPWCVERHVAWIAAIGGVLTTPVTVIGMLRRAAEIVEADRMLFVTHTSAVQEMAKLAAKEEVRK